MNVGIIQSSFIPWVGYFDFIDDVDAFIFFDDVQYTKRDWRNRNILKIKQGTVWASVPVKYRDRSQLIVDTEIDYSSRWIEKLSNLMYLNYKKAAYFEQYYEQIVKIMRSRRRTISELNIEIILWIMKELTIKTRTYESALLNATGQKTERLICLLKKIDATQYLSGPAARDYIDVEKFRGAGIGLSYKEYEYRPYPQLHGKFVPKLSIVDLLFNCGPSSREYLKSLKSNEVVLPCQRN